MMNTAVKQGSLFTVAAASGTGKTSLVKALVETLPDLIVSVSYTTRSARPGEVDGINYHFLNEQKFSEMVENSGFLEHAKVFHYYYGTSASWVQQQLSKGQNVILEIDWQGVKQVKRLFQDCLRIFILPPSLSVLKQRLELRGQDDEAIIEARLSAAKEEIRHYKESDFLMINDDFNTTLDGLKTIIETHKMPTYQSQMANQALAEQLIL